jgi:RhtB (resistance to homoserine/threonine) family protein
MFQVVAMLTQFFTIAVLMILSAMLPGPDFALVIKNTISYSRRAGLFTSFGVGSAILVHITYCALGLAIVISQSIVLFNTVKYIGAAYLIYLGVTALLAKSPAPIKNTAIKTSKKSITDFKAFRQGFLCNLLNPKATLFFLALFTMIIKPDTSVKWEIIFAIEMFVIITTWFCFLTLILSHPAVLHGLNKIEKVISKALGVFLVGFGVALAFIKKG